MRQVMRILYSDMNIAISQVYFKKVRLSLSELNLENADDSKLGIP